MISCVLRKFQNTSWNGMPDENSQHTPNKMNNNRTSKNTCTMQNMLIIGRSKVVRSIDAYSVMLHSG